MEWTTLEEARRAYPMYNDLSDSRFIEAYERNLGVRVQRPQAKGNFLWQRGDIDTPGEALGADIGKAIGSGMTRAAAGIAGLPGAVSNTVYDALDNLGIRERPEGERNFGFPEAMAAADRISRNIDADAPLTSYEPQSTPGEYAQTVSEFVGGAGLTGGLSGLRQTATNVVAPALASETAGQAFEDTALEGPARMAAALGTPLAASMATRGFRGNPVPQQRIDSVRRLEAQGVTPTAGQALDNPSLRYAEAATARGRAITDQALDQYTQAALKQAVPPTVAARAQIGQQATVTQQFDALMTAAGDTMDSLAKRNNIPMGNAFRLRQRARSIEQAFGRKVSRGSKTDYFKELADEFDNIAVLDGKEFQRHRTELGALVKSPDEITRTAAREMLSALTDAMEGAIAQKGNLTDIQLYRDARFAYSNLLTLERALGQVPGRSGNAQITPASLASAASTRDKRGFVRGRSPFDNLIRDGNELNISAPPQSGTTPHALAQAGGPLVMGGGVGAALGAATGIPGGATTGAALGIAAPPIRNNMLSSQTMQEMLRKNMTSRAAPRAFPRETLPGLLPIFSE